MMEVVVETRLKTRPVMTSMSVMWYSTITPFASLGRGGFHDRLREVDLTREVATFSGGPVGTERERESSRMCIT